MSPFCRGFCRKWGLWGRGARDYSMYLHYDDEMMSFLASITHSRSDSGKRQIKSCYWRLTCHKQFDNSSRFGMLNDRDSEPHILVVQSDRPVSKYVMVVWLQFCLRERKKVFKEHLVTRAFFVLKLFTLHFTTGKQTMNTWSGKAVEWNQDWPIRLPDTLSGKRPSAVLRCAAWEEATAAAVLGSRLQGLNNVRTPCPTGRKHSCKITFTKQSKATIGNGLPIGNLKCWRAWDTPSGHKARGITTLHCLEETGVERGSARRRPSFAVRLILVRVWVVLLLLYEHSAMEVIRGQNKDHQLQAESDSLFMSHYTWWLKRTVWLV